jgi:hypothetical protein
MSRLATQMKVNGVKGHTTSDDGTTATVTFGTKYVGDLALTMPCECIDEIIVALEGVRSAAPAALTSGITARTGIAAKREKGTGPVQVRTPRKWLVTADQGVRDGIVLLVFDHQSESQTGFALSARAAKEVAAGLVNEADAVLAQRRKT